MNIELVDQSEIDATWPLIVDRILSCADDMDTDCDPAELFVKCRAGAGFLFVARDGDEVPGFAICVFEKWTKGTVFHCLIMAGQGMKQWRPDMEKLAAEFGRFGGATRFAWKGREGWAAVHPSAKVVSVTMVKDI
jgi:hypothetical protein